MIGNDHVRFGGGSSEKDQIKLAPRRRSTLRRLRLHGLIRKLDGRNCYELTDDGRRFAVFSHLAR